MTMHMLNLVDEANRQLARELAERHAARARAPQASAKPRRTSLAHWFRDRLHRPRHITRLRLTH